MLGHVLVTGASGYLGSLLCQRLLEAGWHVTALDQRPFPNPNFQSQVMDVCDEAALRPFLEKADLIIPLAALVGAPLCKQFPDKAWQINLEAIQIINRLRSRRQLVIFPMTNNGYRPETSKTWVTEKDAWAKQVSLYTETKIRAEETLLSSGGAVSFRLASLFGLSPSMRWDLLIHNFVQMAVTEKNITLYEKNFKRNFIHIEDVIEAFLFAAKHADSMAGEAFNLSQPAADFSKWDLAKKIQHYLPELKIDLQESTEDPDARDFFMSTEKLAQAGFTPSRFIDNSLPGIIDSAKQTFASGIKK